MPTMTKYPLKSHFAYTYGLFLVLKARSCYVAACMHTEIHSLSRTHTCIYTQSLNNLVEKSGLAVDKSFLRSHIHTHTHTQLANAVP